MDMGIRKGVEVEMTMKMGYSDLAPNVMNLNVEELMGFPKCYSSEGQWQHRRLCGRTPQI